MNRTPRRNANDNRPDPEQKIAIGYCRVSTDQEADRGVSLDAQAEKIRAMATVHDAQLLKREHLRAELGGATAADGGVAVGPVRVLLDDREIRRLLFEPQTRQPRPDTSDRKLLNLGVVSREGIENSCG